MGPQFAFLLAGLCVVAVRVSVLQYHSPWSASEFAHQRVVGVKRHDRQCDGDIDLAAQRQKTR